VGVASVERSGEERVERREGRREVCGEEVKEMKEKKILESNNNRL
jgi:hypothetical protein